MFDTRKALTERNAALEAKLKAAGIDSGGEKDTPKFLTNPEAQKSIAALKAENARLRSKSGTPRPSSAPVSKTTAPPPGNLAHLRAAYDSAKKEGQAERLAWWDMNGEAYLAAIAASRAPKSERIKDQFAAMPPGSERTAFYKKHRDTFMR